mgnify:FL=1
MPNAVLIIERITCLKLYRQVFQGLKAHCYSQRLSLFFALLFSCVCSDCDAVGVTFLPTSANLYRHIYCTIFIHSTGLLRTFGLLHFFRFSLQILPLLAFSWFLVLLYSSEVTSGIWFCGKNIIPYLEVNFSFYWVTSF